MLSYILQIVGTEWLWIIIIVVFLLFGSNKIPEVSRNIGKIMREIQRGRAEIEREFSNSTLLPSTTPPKKLNRNLREPITINDINKTENKNKKEENVDTKIENVVVPEKETLNTDKEEKPNTESKEK